MEITTLRLSDLNVYENNAREHSDTDIEAIMYSIQTFGFNDPIGVWGNKNIIVEGHGRYYAAKKLGINEVPCIRLDWLSDEERRAYALAHNKTAELSGWNFEKLEKEIEKVEGFDMEKFNLLFSDQSREMLTDDMFSTNDEKEPKKIQCPDCGEWFEI